MADGTMPLAEMLGHLERLALDALPLWDVPAGAGVRLINVSENATYLVEAPGFKAVLRVHRDGYHSRRAIACELAWLDALDRDGVLPVPKVIPGLDGDPIQTARHPALVASRFLVLFEFIPGAEPVPQGNIAPHFEALGEMAARLHEHSIAWARPEPFERLVWDDAAVFGEAPTWGNWRDAPGVDAAARQVLQSAEDLLRARLAAFGKAADRYGLIHADMRLANLLAAPGQPTRLIDFDDCGMGWFLYDFAAAVSFIETDPELPQMQAAWVRGYRRLRGLSEEEVAELDSFVLLRRFALLAWIGSHIEAPEPQALAPTFAAGTVDIARRYLVRFG